MKLRSSGLLVLALAFAAPALAQQADPPPPAKQKSDRLICAFCGAVRDSGDVCPFCGSKETQTLTPSSEKPAGEPVPGRTKEPAPPPPPSPRKEAPPSSNATPPDDELGEKRKQAYEDDNMAKGDYYFKTGYYLKASEAYRVAVLAEPVNPWKKLAFGHALFAIGNYSYSSYALRRAVSQLDAKTPFNPDVASLFPSKRAFEKAIKDLKRYVTYSPRDPAGLSVLGYMLFAQGEDDRSKEMFVYLQRLPQHENDPFASFFLKQIEARKGDAKSPDLTEPKAQKPSPPPPPPPPPPAVDTPEGAREGEQPARVKPAPAKALAE